MHIPDGSLSPATCVVAYVAAAPFWAVASRKATTAFKVGKAPVLALCSAYCFTIMLFNIPIIGGSTGHAVGAVLAAILVGPWAAVLCVTIALVLQFFMFNDGGITTLGANCLNMAIIMPLVGYGVYRLISGASPLDSKIRWIAASLGGYVGINFAALSAGVMLGLQPLISHDSMGRALYAPFPLKIAVPAMLGGHMLFFGVFEAVATGLVVRYIQKAEPSLLRDTAFSRGLSPKSTAAEDAA